MSRGISAGVWEHVLLGLVLKIVVKSYMGILIRLISRHARFNSDCCVNKDNSCHGWGINYHALGLNAQR